MRGARLAMVGTVVLLAGCGSGNSPSSTSVSSKEPVALHLETFDQAVVGSHDITVKGTATEGATVVVHGHAAQMSGEKWSARVGLHSGSNKIAVKATLEGHAPAETSVTIIQRPRPSQSEEEISRIAHEI